MPIREVMKPSIKPTTSKLLNLPDALEANVRAGDLWSLYRALTDQPRAMWPARSVAAVRLPSLRTARRHH
jgi:hypothetical protein